ncbi:hypothetical protein ACVW1C_003502 [Bradyrhizobium sp. USDA 4011]
MPTAARTPVTWKIARPRIAPIKTPSIRRASCFEFPRRDLWSIIGRRDLKSANSSLHELKRDEIRWNRHRALAPYLSMIFSENRFTLFRIML